MVQTFRLNNLPGSFTIDFYRTQFQNQIVVDLDASPQQVNFYNLKGKSYSNSFQAQIDYEIFTRFDARVAYRWYDVRTTYGDQLLDKPLVAKQRLFLNLAYSTENNWAFDYTINWLQMSQGIYCNKKLLLVSMANTWLIPTGLLALE